MEMNTLRGAILDLDGTLLDSMNIWADIDRKILEEFGAPYDPSVSERVKKMSIKEFSLYFKEEFGLSLTPKEIADKIETMAALEYRENIPLKEGAIELLDGLDHMGIKYGVATATYPELAKDALERLGVLSRLQFLVTEAETGLSKRKPKIYYECAKKLELGKRQIIVAEDALHSIQTASKAGFFTAGVYDPATSSEDWKQICAIATVSVTKVSDIINRIQ